jgi:hypothetical protein
MDIDVNKITEQDNGSEYITYLTTVDQRKVLGCIFQVWLPKIDYMSVDSLKDNILNSIELARETLEWKKNATLNKRCKSIYNYIQKGIYKRESLMKIVTNTILSSDGFGLKV